MSDQKTAAQRETIRIWVFAAPETFRSARPYGAV